VKTYDIPLIIRGKIITDHMVEYEGRRGELTFRTPDVTNYLDQLPLTDPTSMADMYELTFDDVVAYLDELGKRLSPIDNAYMQEAYELSCITSGLTPEILYSKYCDVTPAMLSADTVREVADARIGISTLEGWTRQVLGDGRVAYTRPFGARCVHVTAGNSPSCAGITTLWNAITRGDAVIKSPSNDPLTSTAIGRTMIDMAPDHPLTKHYSVAYWKGGNTEFERRIYSPENFEKVVAWGGFASMKHITRYLQPGLELVAMDPKLSGTIVGKEAFESDATMQKVAGLIAMDFGSSNQEGCANARVISIQSGTDSEGLARLDKLAEYTYEALLRLPVEISAPHRYFSQALKEEIAGIRGSNFYHVVGGLANLGAVIVSHIPDPVDFAESLACRVANFVPCDEVEEALRLITIHTQTIGVYPDSLKTRYRDKLALLGGQRIVSLGQHLALNWALPHDGIEPLRRLCRWINDENCAIEDATVPA
jgi:Acyl-CoA reductase (LuxC)